jgi:predicted ATPase
MIARATLADERPMDARLTRLAVAGFKSLRSVEVTLRPLNVLIGANGSGKSNFVGIFGLLGELVNSRLQVYLGRQGGADAVLTNGIKSTPRLRIEATFGQNSYLAVLEPAPDGTMFFENESARFHGPGHGRPFEEPLGAGHRESRLSSSDKKVPEVVLDAMRGWRVYHFHDTSAAAKVKQAGELNDNAVLRSDAANLAAFLYLLQRKLQPAYRQIVETVRMVAPFFEDFALEPDRLNPDSIRLAWRARGTDAYFGPHALSDGTLRFICLATVLLQPLVPSAVVIDEPELGLHPYAITLLAELLRMASQRAQVIVSTQSVTLVNQLQPEDLLVVEQGDDGSTFRRPTQAEAASWLEEYGLGELWEKNILGGRPR